MQYSQIFFVVTTTTTTTTTAAAAAAATIKHDKRPKIDTNKDIKSNQRQREKGRERKRAGAAEARRKKERTKEKKEEASQNSALSLDELSPCSYDPSVDKLHDLLPYTWVLHMLL